MRQQFQHDIRIQDLRLQIQKQLSVLYTDREKEGMEARYEDRKLQIAVRGAKAALLLSSLKSSVNRVFEAANDDKTEVKEKMRKEMESLNLKEPLKMKKIKICEMVENRWFFQPSWL
ncbi:hypothetical protein GQ457_07G023570 [Hibiscus cannabinus]